MKRVIDVELVMVLVIVVGIFTGFVGCHHATKKRDAPPPANLQPVKDKVESADQHATNALDLINKAVPPLEKIKAAAEPLANVKGAGVEVTGVKTDLFAAREQIIILQKDIDKAEGTISGLNQDVEKLNKQIDKLENSWITKVRYMLISLAGIFFLGGIILVVGSFFALPVIGMITGGWKVGLACIAAASFSTWLAVNLQSLVFWTGVIWWSSLATCIAWVAWKMLHTSTPTPKKAKVEPRSTATNL